MPRMAQRAEREARAVKLALAGRSYDDIAVELGFANRSGAWKAVRRALEREVVDGARELREMELARLDALQVAYWGPALAGDHRAANLVLKVIGKRGRLLGLDRVQREVDQPPTLVIGDSREEFMAGLREIDAGVVWAGYQGGNQGGPHIRCPSAPR